MRILLFPVHLFLANKRRRQHNPGPYLGAEVRVPRAGKPDVRVRLYRPKADKPLLPVLFNVHGGSWIFGDAEGLDLQSQYLANHLCCAVVNIDYRLLDDRPFPYQQTEVADAVAYFLSHAGEFRLMPEHAALAGYSAGGHISAGAAMLLRERHIKLAKQVLCYPFLNYVGFDFSKYENYPGFRGRLLNRLAEAMLFEKMPKDSVLLSPANAEPDALKGLADALIITCGAGDMLLPQGKLYAQKLRAAGVDVVYKEFEEAVHGFLEHNFADDPALFAEEDLQDTLMRQAVDFIAAQDIFNLL